jgi:hypothetical protein
VTSGALGDVDGMLGSFAAGARAEPGVDGVASAAHTSTAPIMASPTAIKALRGRLEFQLDEPNISLDPLVDGGWDTESPHGMAGAPLVLPSAPIVWMLRI